MAYLWIVTIGFIALLGMVGGTFIYFLRFALDPKDAVRVDPLETDYLNTPKL